MVPISLLAATAFLAIGSAVAEPLVQELNAMLGGHAALPKIIGLRSGFPHDDNLCAYKKCSQDKSQSRTFLKKDCVYWGWIPDDGDHSHGSDDVLEKPAELNKAVGTPARYWAYYGATSIRKSTYFDGREVLPAIKYLKGTGAIAVLSLMPTYGWGELNYKDNTQALQVVKVLKKFDEACIENYYTQPNTDDAHSGKSYYVGGGPEFIEGWKTMVTTVKRALPHVKMFWSPNIGSPAEYAEFWPGSETVDIVGVDGYPQSDQIANLAAFVQDIHDTYAVANNLPFHVGETGSTDGEAVKTALIKAITSKETCAKLPRLEAVHWFNYQKGQPLVLCGDYRVAQPGGGGMTAKFIELMK